MNTHAIERKLKDVIRIERRIWLLRSAGAMLAALAMIAAVHFALDWGLRPGTTWRALMLAAFAGAIAYAAWREVWQPWCAFPSEDDVALEIERRFSGLRGRFISVHQLARNPAGGSPSLIARLIDETTRLVGRLSFHEVPDRKPRNRALAAAFLTVAVWAAFVGLTPTGRRCFPVWLTRLVNPLSTMEYPTKTMVIVEDGDRIIPRGDDVLLKARAAGIIPASGSLFIRRADGRWIEQPVTGRGRDFEFIQKAALQSFHYYWQLGDGRSEEYKVEVVVPPQVRAISARFEFPKYTRRAPESVEGGNLEGLPGSTATLTIVSNKPVRSGELRLTSGGRVPLKSLSSSTHTATVPIVERDAYRIHLVDDNGFQNRDPMDFLIQPAVDLIPRLELGAVSDRQFVTPYATLPIEIHAWDDFGIAKIQLHVQVAGGEEETIEIPTRESRNDVIVNPILPLEPRNVEPHTEVLVWASALDNRAVGGPQRGESSRVRLEVVSPEEMIALLRERMESLFPQIEKVTQEAIESKTTIQDILEDRTKPEAP